MKLLHEQAIVAIYDPNVKHDQILSDLEYLGSLDPKIIKQRITVVSDPYQAMTDAHAVAILTEWDEFTTYDWKWVYDKMIKPAFVFDGMGVTDRLNLENINFQVFRLGKSSH